MAKHKAPVTAAVRVLREHGVAFTDHLYEYEERGGTATSARELGVPEHAVIKTLIMEDEAKKPLIVLMHGDMKVSTRELARTIGVKTVSPCTPETANRHSGYIVGGTSPLGTRKEMTVYLEASVLELDRIYVNGGKRGYLVGIAPDALVRIVKPVLVRVAQADA